MKKKAVETVENKKHVSHRFHSTAATAVINFEEFIFSKVRNLTDATHCEERTRRVISTKQSLKHYRLLRTFDTACLRCSQ